MVIDYRIVIWIIVICFDCIIGYMQLYEIIDYIIIKKKINIMNVREYMIRMFCNDV